MKIEELLLHFDRDPKGSGKYRCPVHDGYSLSIGPGKRRAWVIKCFGCDASYKEIMDAAGVAKPGHDKTMPKLRFKQPRMLTRKALAENAPLHFESAWNEASVNCGRHPYLVKKDVGSWGIRRCQNTLILPMWQVDNQIHGIQGISMSGEKRFWPGSAASGAFFYLDAVYPKASHVWIAEGYATAATVLSVVQLQRNPKIPVICCFTAGNLPKLVPELVKRNPGQRIYIAADNDVSGTGQKYAELALAAGADWYTMPDVPGDWNDHQNLQGLQRTADEIYGY